MTKFERRDSECTDQLRVCVSRHSQLISGPPSETFSSVNSEHLSAYFSLVLDPNMNKSAVPKPKGPPTLISSYFSPPAKKSNPRNGSPIDLTGASDEEGDDTARRIKRVKLDHQGPFSVAATSDTRPSQSHTVSPVEQWRFDPSQPAIQPVLSAAETAKRRKNHEAFKRKLLSDNSIFVRRSDEPEAESGGSSKSNSDVSDDETVAPSTSKKGKGKLASDIGPSGETWTPMELQVRLQVLNTSANLTFYLQIRQLKKQHPFFLFVECGYK